MGFLEHTPLFQDLDQSVLRSLTDSIELEIHPRGTVIHQPDGPVINRLRIIKEGAVKVTIPFGQSEDALVDYRGMGEVVGFMSLLTGGKPRGEAVALEDTTCYVIDRSTVLDLLRSQPLFSQQFFSDFLNRYVNKPHRDIGRKKLLYGGRERLLFDTPVGELARRPLITAQEDVSIREAAEIMSSHHIGALVLLNHLGLPAGIVTNKDFRDRVVTRGRDVSQPVKRIQSVSLVKAEAGEHCIEALFKMIHYNIRHLLVVESGRLKGIVTAQDLLRLQGASPISLIQEIESQPSIDGLVDPSGRIQAMVGVFLKEGVKAAHILRIMNEVHDRLLRQVVALVEKRLGPPPLPYCFLSLGCAGRKEQAFMLPQQNAVIHADPPNPEAAEAAQRYFAAFSSSTVQRLEQLGFPSDNRNPSPLGPCWCQSLSRWKATVSAWIKRADRKSVDASLPLFDFRTRHGDEGLSENLRNSMFDMLGAQETFLNVMALNIVKTSPPISAFKKFVLEREGEHKGRFNLKQKGLKPLVDIVRLYALKEGVKETSTQERLDLLRESTNPLQGYCQELDYAFEVMSGLWLQAQYGQWREGEPLQAYIDPNHLNKLEKQALKAIFSFVARLQFVVKERHELIRI